MRLRQAIVEADGALQGFDGRARDVAAAIVSEAQLVDDARSAIVQAQAALVVVAAAAYWRIAA